MLFVMLLILISLASPSFAANYIAGPSGTATSLSNCTWSNYPDAYAYSASDTTNTCTPLAVFANAGAGDVVFFRGGSGGNYSVQPTSYINPVLAPSNSGTEANPITFKNYPGEVPIIVNSYNTATSIADDGGIGPVMGIIAKNYIIFDGFQIGNTQTAATEGFSLMRFTGGTGNQIKNCVFKQLNNFYNVKGWTYANPCMIGLYGNEGTALTDTTISNCYLTGGQDGDSSMRFNAIITYDSTRTIVEYSTITHSHGGICLKDGAIDWTIRFNFITDCDDTYPIIKVGHDGAGIHMSGLSAYQNIIVMGSSNWGAFGSWNPGDSGNIYNNTIYGGNGTYNSMWATSDDAGNDGLNFWNNAIDRFNQAYKFKAGESPDYSDYNIFGTANTFSATISDTARNWDYYTGTLGYDSHGYNEAITWANAGGTAPEDYKFTSSHKANGRGGAYASVIGAYITGSEQIGYSSGGTTPPNTRKLNNVTGVRVTLH